MGRGLIPKLVMHGLIMPLLGLFLQHDVLSIGSTLWSCTHHVIVARVHLLFHVVMRLLTLLFSRRAHSLRVRDVLVGGVELGLFGSLVHGLVEVGVGACVVELLLR
jgi:hypothetical protein